jgi:hypothetical protein
MLLTSTRSVGNFIDCWCVDHQCVSQITLVLRLSAPRYFVLTIEPQEMSSGTCSGWRSICIRLDPSASICGRSLPLTRHVRVDKLTVADGCLLGCCAVSSDRSLPAFQRSLLPPSSGRWLNVYQTTRRNISEDSHLNSRRRENLKCHQVNNSHSLSNVSEIVMTIIRNLLVLFIFISRHGLAPWHFPIQN